MPKSRELAQANLENIFRIFTVPEAPDSTLGRIDQAISDNLTGFLQSHIVAVERDLDEIEMDFSQSIIPENPTFVSDYTEFLKEKLDGRIEIPVESPGKTCFSISTHGVAGVHRAHDLRPPLLHAAPFPNPDRS